MICCYTFPFTKHGEKSNDEFLSISIWMLKRNNDKNSFLINVNLVVRSKSFLHYWHWVQGALLDMSANADKMVFPTHIIFSFNKIC